MICIKTVRFSRHRALLERNLVFIAFVLLPQASDPGMNFNTGMSKIVYMYFCHLKNQGNLKTDVCGNHGYGSYRPWSCLSFAICEKLDWNSICYCKNKVDSNFPLSIVTLF